MKVIKWLDKHFEEAILIFMLVVISCVTLAQVICRNTPITSLSWAEELCRFCWIATVFLSLPYCIRTETSLRVNALLDIMPWKLHNAVNIFVDAFTFAMMAVLTNASVAVLNRIIASGETSPAIMLPMWIMYLIVLIGFALAALRSIQMFIIHAKTFNVPPKNSVEEQAAFELDSADTGATEEDAHKKDEADAIKAAFSNGGRDN